MSLGIEEIALLCLSPFVGSFLNVVIDRVPRGESVILPASSCRSCSARLGLPDLMPILSYLWLRGKCRHCGAPFATWHLYVEISAAACAVFAVIVAQDVLAAWLVAAILWVLLCLTATDLIRFRLPDLLTASLLGLALAYATLTGVPSLAEALIAGTLGTLSFWAIRIGYQRARGREGLGMGDVKLMAGLGALLGLQDLPAAVLLAALSGLGLSLALMAMGRARADRHLRLPFGSYLCLSTAAVWLWRASGTV